MTEETYRCESCNGIMEYDIESKQMKCPNCGNCVPIFNDEDSIVEHRLTMDAKRAIKPSEKTSCTMECSGCGAAIEIGKDDTTSECPYCGSSYVLAQKQLDAIIPDGIVPFNIDKIRAKEIFYNWVKKRWLAPGKLKNLYQEDKIQGLYLPYWTFDADSDADYTAMGGKNRTEHYKDKDGNTHTKTVTDWYHTHGHVHHQFDDLLIKAIQNENSAFLESIEPFDMGRLVSYSPQYLSGQLSQCFNVDLESAHYSAREDMAQQLRSCAREQVLRRYDTVRDIRIHPVYRNESYKHVLVPVYSTCYHYEGKLYQVAINGQTGEIHGAYPKSPVKIALLVLAGLAILGAILYGYYQNDNSYHGSIDAASGYEYCYDESADSNYNALELYNMSQDVDF